MTFEGQSMKNQKLKVIASLLSVSTILSSVPISAKSSAQEKSRLPLGAKIAMGVGGVGIVATGVAGLVCWLAKANSDDQSKKTVSDVETQNVGSKKDNSTDSGTKVVNPHFTSSKEVVCLKKMVMPFYNNRLFKNFILKTNLEALSRCDEPELALRIKIFRELFQAIDKKLFAMETEQLWQDLAKEVFGDMVIGDDQDTIIKAFRIFAEYIKPVNTKCKSTTVILKPGDKDMLFGDSVQSRMIQELLRNNINFEDPGERNTILSVFEEMPDYKYDSDMDANFTNIDNLCYWHALAQQLYSLRAFRKFVDEINLTDINTETADKIKALRELFAEMDSTKGGRIDPDTCVKFAKRILGKIADKKYHPMVIGYIKDVFECYGRFYRINYNNQYVDVLLNTKYKKLQDLFLSESSSIDMKEINVLEDQFVIFVAHDCEIDEKGGIHSVELGQWRRIDFGNGIVEHMGKKYELTAASVQVPGHYYTYKKHGDTWYRYDDIKGRYSGAVTLEEFKKDAEKNCVMLTFNLKK